VDADSRRRRAYLALARELADKALASKASSSEATDQAEEESLRRECSRLRQELDALRKQPQPAAAANIRLSRAGTARRRYYY